MTLLTSLITRLQSWALTALAVLAVLVGAYVYGGSKAKRAAELGQAAKDLANARKTAHELVDIVEKKNETDEDVDKLPDGSAADELRRDWSRDKDHP